MTANGQSTEIERHRVGAVTLIVLLSLLVFIPAFRGVRDDVFMDFLDIGLPHPPVIIRDGFVTAGNFI